MIAVETCDEFQVINQQIEELIQIATVGNSEKLVSKMKEIVPEFKSLNSIFQKLDLNVNNYSK
jgi:hypothetical protein